MSLSVGIVGLPNVGKSTIFNALTAAGADSANYPFCTIDPNHGVVPIPDARLQRIARYIPRDQIIPTTLDAFDIAGLVKGASKGEGLGNRFLAHIRETHAILMVVRCFDDANVVHVDGAIDPIRDIEVIELELGLADLETVQKRQHKSESAAKTGKPEAKAELAYIQGLGRHLDAGRPARSYPVETPEQQEIIDEMHLLTVKPVLYCCNVGEDDLPDGNEYVERVRARASADGAGVVVLCGKIEEELTGLEADDLAEMLEAYGLEDPALHKLIHASYALLGLQSFFTYNDKEIRAWTIPVVIHTDFERGFIRANVFGIEDLETYESEAAIRAAGKLRSEGKEYVVYDGDVVFFLFNV